MQRKLKNFMTWTALASCIPLTVFFPKIFGSRGYYLAAFLFALLAIISVILSFENSKPNTLKVSVIAVMCAFAIAGRMVFAGVPFVKPVGAFVIIAGAMLGSQAGFLCGTISMLISNFMFGQGPWTLWQMLAFGTMGFLAGYLFHKKDKLKTPALLAVFGFVCYVAVTGPILDLSGIFAYTMPGKVSFTATLIAGLPVNLTGGVSTALFLSILSRPIMKKLDRLIIKHGLE